VQQRRLLLGYIAEMSKKLLFHGQGEKQGLRLTLEHLVRRFDTSDVPEIEYLLETIPVETPRGFEFTQLAKLQRPRMFRFFPEQRLQWTLTCSSIGTDVPAQSHALW
jgi:hypothetical protein